MYVSNFFLFGCFRADDFFFCRMIRKSREILVHSFVRIFFLIFILPGVPGFIILILLWSFLHRSFSRSEEHTSELQSQSNLVCRLLLENKNLRRSWLTGYSATAGLRYRCP